MSNNTGASNRYQATYTGPREPTPGVEICYQDGNPKYLIHTFMFSALDDDHAREHVTQTLRAHPTWTIQTLHRMYGCEVPK